MPDWVRFPLVLMVVGLISAASLAGLYKFTAPVVKANEVGEIQNALNAVLPDAEEFDSVKDAAPDLPIYYVAKGEEDEVVGYAVEGEAQGYGGPIGVMIGVDKSFKINRIKIYKQKETPGLGDKIIQIISQKTWKTVLTGTSPDESALRPYFQVQFDDQNAPVKLKKDGGTIEAITGATISSQAVVDAVNTAIIKLRGALGANLEEEV